MEKTLKEIASIIDGEIIGDESTVVTGDMRDKRGKKGRPYFYREFKISASYESYNGISHYNIQRR